MAVMPPRTSTAAPPRASTAAPPRTSTGTPNRYAPPRAAVRDVADPYASTELAGRGARLGAALLDSLILGVMVYVPLILGAVIGPAVAGPDGAGVVMAVTGGLTLAGLITWCWLTIKYVVADGQSIAKKLLSIKVVRSDGSPISLGRIFWLRNFVNGLISIIPLYGLIELLFIFGESRQCLHDKIADTIVVKA